MPQAPSTRDVVHGFGDAVRAAREARSLTQTQLAQKAGLHPSAVSKVEKGVRAPSLRLALDLADALGVPVGELVPAGWRKT